MLCYDSVTASAIPADAPMVGGYIDGRYAWSAADWERFPRALKMRIVINPAHDDGDVYDCEPGNGHPPDAGPWAAKRNRAGVTHPCVYCSNNEWWPAIRDSVARAGATGVVYWVAQYFNDRQYHPIPGTVGVQYVDVGPYDLSEFTDTTWLTGSPAPPPAPPPPPTTTEDEDMKPFLLANHNGVYIIWPAATGPVRTWVTNPADVDGLLKQFGQPSYATVDDNTMRSIPFRDGVPAELAK